MNWTSANIRTTGGVIPTAIRGIASRRVLPNVGTKPFGNFQAGATGSAPGIGSQGDYFIDTDQRQLKQFQGGAANTVSTFATGFNGQAQLNVDASGNIYVGDSGNAVVKRISPSGVVTIIAGTLGSSGYSGDGGPATSAQLAASYLEAVVVDSSGRVFIWDGGNYFIRMVDTSGNIHTIGGTGTQAFSSDGPALSTSILINGNMNIAIDPSGNIYYSDYNIVRKLYFDGLVWQIVTIAGDNISNSTGYADGTGSSARFNNISGMTIDTSGNLYVNDTNNNYIRKINISTGVVTTLPNSMFSGNQTCITYSNSLLYLATPYHIYKYNLSTNQVTLIAGTTSGGYLDGISTQAKFGGIYGIVARNGALYVSDLDNSVIRKITLGTAADWSTITNFNTPDVLTIKSLNISSINVSTVFAYSISTTEMIVTGLSTLTVRGNAAFFQDLTIERLFASSITNQSTINFIDMGLGDSLPIYASNSLLYLGHVPLIPTQGVTSTVTGLGSSGYVSSLSLASTVGGLASSGFISLASTVKGLGSSGYVSSLSLASTVGGLASSGFISLASTVTGLGSSGYISSLIHVTQVSSLLLETHSICTMQTINGATYYKYYLA
jgi:streptogramin lyase